MDSIRLSVGEVNQMKEAILMQQHEEEGWIPHHNNGEKDSLKHNNATKPILNILTYKKDKI